MANDTITVTSTLFADGEPIPQSAAHPMVGGDNISPDLSWSGGPDATQSYALTCHDPDAPTGVGFVHWVMFNIPAATTSLEAGTGAAGKNPAGSVLGFTDWGESAYGGCAPPQGDPPHHYNFTVYALDVPSLDLGPTTTYALLRFMIRGQVLAQGTLTGTYAVS
jgi:Raf kinase inhibitor-like YbhB/YbcL family protein